MRTTSIVPARARANLSWSPSGRPAAFTATLVATAGASLRHKALLPGWLAAATIVPGVVK
jgi:hypothetical protein